jgi:hypothetical protein
MKRVAFTLVEFIVVIIIMGILSAVLLLGMQFLVETPFLFLFGWIWGLWRLVVGLVNEPAAVGFGVLAFLLLPIAIHVFVAQIAKRFNKQWTFKKSFVVSSLIILIAGAGIATVGGVHEIIWLFGSKEPLLEIHAGGRAIAYRMQSNNNLRQQSLGIYDYFDANDKHLPFGGTILDNGKLGHGWMTQLLPYLERQELYKKIDFSKSWDDPVNAAVFRERGHYFQSPYFWRLPEAEQTDQNGFVKTDYAANQFVFPVGKSLRVADITDGFSNTIFSGETVKNLRAWGSPLNSRNPKLGINKSPYGFGSKHIRGMNFALGDCAVKFFNEQTDQKILDALATPNGGEPEEVP